jgi:ribosome-associated heat shock protein Hsp15
MTEKPNVPQKRLDQWLWFARLMKSRTSAAELISNGKVRVNRVRVVKPSHMLREGDVITIIMRGAVRVIEVVALGQRRGPPEEARLLYRSMDSGERSRPAERGQKPVQAAAGALLDRATRRRKP